MHPSNETSGGRSLLNETQPLEYIRRVTCINLNGGNATLAALSNEAPPSEQKSQSLISKFSTSLQLPLFTVRSHRRRRERQSGRKSFIFNVSRRRAPARAARRVLDCESVEES